MPVTHAQRDQLRRLALAATAVGLLSAFSSAATFEFDAEIGGGGGYLYTGSPTSHGMGCNACHQDGGNSAALRLSSSPPGLFDVGYDEGQAYEIHLELAPEIRGLDRNGSCKTEEGGCNRNLFIAELLSDNGTPTGTLCADGGAFAAGVCDVESGKETALMLAGAAVAGHSLKVPILCDAGGTNPQGCLDVEALKAAGQSDAQVAEAVRAQVRARTSWRFVWRAPKRSRARVHFYAGAVDGDGGAAIDPRFADYYGDSVAMVHRVIRSTAAVDEDPIGACSAGGRGTPGGVLMGVLAALLILFTSRRALPRSASTGGAPRLLLGGLLIALAITALPTTAHAVDTSCDVVTGASCLWGEGCDCDHDGYVRDSGKSKKYCHFNKCPLDANDLDATVLGKPSSYNADGDGWTKAYDCDDNDPCVGKSCADNSCVTAKDADGDGFAAELDCDDNNNQIKPGAGVACCNCDVLGNPELANTYGCLAQPCPFGQPPKDAGQTQPTDTNSGPADAGGAAATGDGGGTAQQDGGDVGGGLAEDADTGLKGGNEAIGGPGSFNGGAAGGFVGGGSDAGQTGAGASCQASRVGAPALAWPLLILVVMALGWRRIRRIRRIRLAVALALLVLGLLSSGCATVKPWQRQHLARGPMLFGGDAGESQLEQHTLQYREGAAGGLGGGGGGCGCN